MAFKPLQERIGKLPLIICGPVVRHCHDKGITVWVALKKPVESVALSIFEDVNGRPGELFAFQSEATLKFGENLHIATITATPILDDKPLGWGSSYLYDLAFDRKKSEGFESLKDEGVLNAIDDIIYSQHKYELPAVRLPPKEVDKLHFVQCSCRNTKGPGIDALPALDDILQQNWTPSKRPQQLFLTGDQIYADEVDAGLLLLITDAAKTLLAGNAGWEEALPIAHKKTERETKTAKAKIKASDFSPDTRRDLVTETAMFTTKDGRSHLLSLGEYFAMYLMVWSDVLWPEIPDNDPVSALPGTDEVLSKWEDFVNERFEAKTKDIDKKLDEALKDTKDEKKRKRLRKDAEAKKKALKKEKDDDIKKRKNDFPKQKIALADFREGIKKVRRALANISTYMIFDDHEVTDDWHLNREWVEEVYKTALGRRVIKNALASFAIFQAWGNTPDQYKATEADLNPGGLQLLTALSQWINAQCAENHPALETISKLVNIPLEGDLEKFIKKLKDGKIPVAEDALKWHFDFQHPSYQTLFTDPRTRRSLPDKRFRPSDHLSEEAIVEQIPLTKKAPEFTLLVSPCNLVTVNYFRNWVGKYLLPAKSGGTGAFSLFKGTFFEDVTRSNMLANDPDLADSWVAQSKAFENIISRLASRVPVREGKRRTRLVVISGDVHFSATMRMQYWAKKPFRIYLDDPTQDNKANIPKDSPSDFVMAHLVCSPSKTEVEIFHYMHYLGYEVDDVLNNKENMPIPEIFLGYHKKDDLGEAKRDEILLNTRWFSQYRPSLTQAEPVMIPFHRRNKNILFPKPDWRYRFDAIRGESLARPQEDPQNVAGLFKKLAPHLIYSKNKLPGLEFISINNIAQLDFNWTGEGKLTQPFSLADRQCELEIAKNFPTTPFQVIIDEEVIEVLEVETIPPIIRFKKLRRGIDHTELATHDVGSTVKVRKTVNHTHWIVEKIEDEKGAAQKPKLVQKSKAITRMVVPMEFIDPFYKEPDVPLEESTTADEATLRRQARL